MNDKDRQYLREVFDPVKEYTLRGETLSIFYEAERILTGATKTYPRGCSCELGGLKEKVIRLYNKLLANEETQKETF